MFTFLTKCGRSLWSILFLLFLLASCKVTLLAPYDEITDNTVTEMQEMTSAFFVALESEPDNAAMKYDNQKQFYFAHIRCFRLNLYAAALSGLIREKLFWMANRRK